jgi:hypothetical protein
VRSRSVQVRFLPRGPCWFATSWRPGARSDRNSPSSECVRSSRPRRPIATSHKSETRAVNPFPVLPVRLRYGASAPLAQWQSKEHEPRKLVLTRSAGRFAHPPASIAVPRRRCSAPVVFPEPSRSSVTTIGHRFTRPPMCPARELARSAPPMVPTAKPASASSSPSGFGTRSLRLRVGRASCGPLFSMRFGASLPITCISRDARKPAAPARWRQSCFVSSVSS